MNSVLSFLSSALFSNILAILGLLIALLPQKNTVSIDNSTNYYFQTTSSKSRNSQNFEIVLVAIVLLVTYILYSFIQPYFPEILLVLSVAIIIKYRWLKIAYKNQMIIPAMLVIIATALNHFLPKEILDYWNQAYKLDLNQLGTLSQVTNQVTTPIVEVKNLILSFSTNPLSVAIFANMFFVFLTTTSMIEDLFKPKRKIKVTKRSSVVWTLIFFAIIISFMFYTSPESPARIVVEKVAYFLSN